MVPRSPQAAVLAASLAAAAVLAFLLAAPADRLVDYLSDDAFYYLRVASHMAEGDGPTFDGLTPTTGFHPLYALILAALYGALDPGRDARVVLALLTNVAAFAAAAALLARAAGRLWGPRAASFAALAWLTNPHALLLPFTGMEGTLCAAAFSGLLAALAGPRAWTVGLAAGLCILARTDGLLLAPLVFGVLALRGSLPRAAAAVGAALLPYALWVLYTQTAGAGAVHGSAEIKRLWRGQATEGLGLLGSAWFSLHLLLTWSVKCLVKTPLFHWFLPWAPAVFRTLPWPGRAVPHLAWLFPAGLGLAYALLLPRTWTWYYAPAIAGLSLVAGGTLASYRTPRRWRAALLLLALIESYGYLGHVLAHGRNREQRDMLSAARWVATHVPADARVAAWNAGIYSWYGGHDVLNLDGLINDEIADSLRRGEPLLDYLERRRVEVVVDFDELLEAIPPERRHVLAHFPSAWHGKPISVVRLMRPGQV